MTKHIDKKISRISEKMAQLREVLENLEKEKSEFLSPQSPDIQLIAQSVLKLANTHNTNPKTILGLVQKSFLSESSPIETVKKTVPPKYQDPNDSNNTWTGRGVTPLWLKRYESIGKHRDEFLIQNS